MADRRRRAQLERRMGRPPEEPCWKVRYGNAAAASAALDAIAQYRQAGLHDGKIEGRAYGCWVCGWWHLTSRPKLPPRSATGHTEPSTPAPGDRGPAPGADPRERNASTHARSR